MIYLQYTPVIIHMIRFMSCFILIMHSFDIAHILQGYYNCNHTTEECVQINDRNPPQTATKQDKAQ